MRCTIPIQIIHFVTASIGSNIFVYNMLHFTWFKCIWMRSNSFYCSCVVIAVIHLTVSILMFILFSSFVIVNVSSFLVSFHLSIEYIYFDLNNLIVAQSPISHLMTSKLQMKITIIFIRTSHNPQSEIEIFLLCSLVEIAFEDLARAVYALFLSYHKKIFSNMIARSVARLLVIF